MEVCGCCYQEDGRGDEVPPTPTTNTAQVMKFLRKPDAASDEPESGAECLFHEIKFHNPRKLWANVKQSHANAWLELLGVLDCNLVDAGIAAAAKSHALNGHLLSFGPKKVLNKNESRLASEVITRSKVYSDKQSDAWRLNNKVLEGSGLGAGEEDGNIVGRGGKENHSVPAIFGNYLYVCELGQLGL